MSSMSALARGKYERELDMTLAGSFPASDPPSWTFGVTSSAEVESPVFARPRPAAIDVVIREGRRLGGIRLSSLGEAITMVATLPLAILIAGLPVVALVWGIAKAISWLTGSG